MNYYLRCDCSMCKPDWFYLLPTIKVSTTNKYFEVEIDFLRVCIYWVFSIGNYEKDES